MDVKIHVRGWDGDRQRVPGGESSALFSGLLEIDGNVYEMVGDITVKTGEKFAVVIPELIPGDVEIVNHDTKTWDALIERNNLRERQYAEQKKIRNADGKLVALKATDEP